MRKAVLGLLLAIVAAPVLAQEMMDGPADEKAKKTYKEAFEYLRRRMPESALDNFKKADKQDGGHCHACQRYMIKYGIELRDWKVAELAAEEMVGEAQGEKAI
ncbi:MAG TPA: hypothetical protein VKL40_18345, partial [Candidatus Angelobacter sp.]|nr:hypothetical protein [Candidatus Angelobacter sp.]